MQQPIALAADHVGYELKALLVKDLADAGIPVVDLGTNSADSVDYPDYADRLAAALKDGRATRGILVCGTGIGISIAANRHRHIRAALCHDETTARLGREHNDANVLALGARVIGPEVARACLKVFLSTPFGGGRHEKRVAKLG
ncbi:MAG: ribose 5-phosphate isomerase B [Proteobacteria bacterium]|nr:ribose 5-phosphate isomerase B [Pseudomonadota bacterium]